MNVYLGDNSTDLIPNDILVSWILRSDLAPVPRTVEFIVQNKDGIDKNLLFCLTLQKYVSGVIVRQYCVILRLVKCTWLAGPRYQ